MKIEIEEFEKERNYLNDTVSLIRKKISNLGQELYDDDTKILEFKKFIWDTHTEMDPNEMRSMMAESDLQVSIMQSKGNYLQRLFRIQNKPYFGSIRFKEDNDESDIYIGITHVEDKLDYYVHDWRSPICSMFYDFETGPAYYKAPGGVISGEITRKRQYIIDNAELKNIFDNDLNISDSLLQEVLAEESSDKMKNIVNTIQEEQNKVIRNTEDKNLIVEGIAGSGKTSVALHRIAFLLYRIPNLNSSNVVVFTPNKVFSEYISNVLPELGEDNTYSMTFYDLLCQNINEYKNIENFTDFISRYYKGNVSNYDLVKYKQSDDIINDIDNYVNDILSNISFTCNLEYDGFIDNEIDELNNMLTYRYDNFLLFERIDEMSKKIASNNYSGNTKHSPSIKKLLKENLNIKLDLKEIYNNFFSSKYSKFKDNIDDKYLYYEDACLFLYLKSLLVGFNTNHVIKQVVIDEAQDYNKLQYLIIKKTFKTADYTILGDTNQTINPYYKYNSLEELTNIFDSSKYITLTKTYRSTDKIIDYINKILGLNHVTAIRNQKSNDIIFRNNPSKLTFTSSDETIATVSNTGLVTAGTTKGSATITVAYEDIKADFAVEVTDDATFRVVLDGKMDDLLWTEEVKSNYISHNKPDGNVKIDLYASKNSRGIYFYADYQTKVDHTGASDWWKGDNIELRLNNPAGLLTNDSEPEGNKFQYWVSRYGVGAASNMNGQYITAPVLNEETGYYELSFEFFVDYKKAGITADDLVGFTIGANPGGDGWYAGPNFGSGDFAVINKISSRGITRYVAEEDCLVEGHEYVSHTSKVVTCVDDGEITHTCKWCGNTYTEVVPAAGEHSFTVELAKTPATCTTVGSVTHKCAGCDEEQTSELPIDPFAHTGENADDVWACCGKHGRDRYNVGNWGDVATWTFAAEALTGDFTVTTTFTLETNGISGNWWRGVLPIVQEDLAEGQGSPWVTRFDWWGWCDKWDSAELLTKDWIHDGEIHSTFANRDDRWTNEDGANATDPQFETAMTKSIVEWKCIRTGTVVRNEFTLTTPDGYACTYWSQATDIAETKSLNLALASEFARYAVIDVVKA